MTLAPLAASSCGKKSATSDPSNAPPASVGVTTIGRHDLPLFIEAVATIDGYVNADIRARVRGYLRGQSYQDGAIVKEGQTLFTIDPSEYNVAVNAAHATLSRAQTAQSRAKIELDRDLGLFKGGNLSQQDLDNAKAALADTFGQVQAAQAALDQASLNLSYTNIKSPITGVAGIALVRVGNLVGQDQPTLLTTVSQTDPIRVTFPLSEIDYVKYPERFKNLEHHDLAWANAQFAKIESGGDDGGSVELVLSDGSRFPKKGVVVAANRNIDSTTGTIQMQALFPNADGLLRPGQFGRVRMKRGDEGHQVITVPEKALVSVQGTYSLAVVGADNKVALKHVELGPSSGGQRVVLSGVAEGDRIVVDGTQRVTDGAIVAPHAAESTSAAAPSASHP
ncbi:MAG TPA: efflux RND transporter periplasmic adaptor subunit, partial [Polyangiaceae bacterium]|jgi:membrane fusion protein (multidrug efflux system)|nr:efflux RND transporter periplasmic adaptor subunit [Polyangiaceae bacterium]